MSLLLFLKILYFFILIYSSKKISRNHPEGAATHGPLQHLLLYLTDQLDSPPPQILPAASNNTNTVEQTHALVSPARLYTGDLSPPLVSTSLTFPLHLRQFAPTCFPPLSAERLPFCCCLFHPLFDLQSFLSPAPLSDLNMPQPEGSQAGHPPICESVDVVFF